MRVVENKTEYRENTPVKEESQPNSQHALAPKCDFILGVEHNKEGE